MKATQAQARYDNPRKRKAREVVVLAARGSESIFDLWGGGASARAFVARYYPAAVVCSCETDEQQWPMMQLDARDNHYFAHLGPIQTLPGKFDFGYLDLTCQWSLTAQEAVRLAKRKLAPGGTLALTLMASREATEIAMDRLRVVPMLVEEASGLKMRLLYQYQTTVPMWLLILDGSRYSPWSPSGRWSMMDSLLWEGPGEYNPAAVDLTLVEEQLRQCWAWIAPGFDMTSVTHDLLGAD